MNTSNDALEGHIQALSMVITGILVGLNQQQTQTAAHSLASAIEAAQSRDSEDQTPAPLQKARDSTVHTYLTAMNTMLAAK